MFTKTYSKRAVWRFFGLMAIGAVMVAVSMFCITKANADSETDFLDEITSNGLEIKGARGAIGIGYEICAALPTNNGTAVVNQIYYGLPAGSSLTYTDIAIILMAAVHNLCPSQDHSQRVGVSA